MLVFSGKEQRQPIDSNEGLLSITQFLVALYLFRCGHFTKQTTSAFTHLTEGSVSEQYRR